MKSFFQMRESSILETKSAPKGYHFTKDGKLKRGDADVDGPGGPKLRSDPLDKQRSKVPPVSEASVDRSKRNPTRDFLRKYPVSDAEMAKPITYYSLVHKATNKVLSTHRDLESAKDEHRGMDQGERAHYRIATSTKAPKSFSMKEEAEDVAEGYTGRETKDGTWHVFKDGQAVAVAGPYRSREEAAAWIKKQKTGVAEAAFKDPSPMFKDSIKQDKIRSLNNLISIAKVKGVHHKVKEYESELKKLKETTEVSEAGPFSYGAKPPRKGSVAYNALMQRKEQDKKRVKEIEAIGTKNHHIGVARVVTKEDVEDVIEANDADKYSYIDQTKGPILKGKTGTFVGYTHSTSKGKGANILKHNKTGKYYAAGGSSTAFTAKTTLHDTPEAAAKAYHKGNLAEENLEEGSKAETEGMVSYIHHIIKNHVYPRGGDKDTYMKHVAKHMPSVVKSNPKLFRRAHGIAYDRFFHVDKDDNHDSFDHTSHSMRQGEMGNHKRVAEQASPMIKPPKNEFGKKEEAFAHAKQHGGKVMKKTFTHPTSGMQTVSYVVKKEDSKTSSETSRDNEARPSWLPNRGKYKFSSLTKQ